MFLIPVRKIIQDYNSIDELLPQEVNSDYVFSQLPLDTNLMPNITHATDKEVIGYVNIDRVEKSGSQVFQGAGRLKLLFYFGASRKFTDSTPYCAPAKLSYTYKVHVNTDQKKYLAYTDGDTLDADQLIFASNNPVLYELTANWEVIPAGTPQFGFRIFGSDTQELKFSTINVQTGSSQANVNNETYAYITGNDDTGSFTGENILGTQVMFPDQSGYRLIDSNKFMVHWVRFLYPSGSTTINSEYVKV